MKRVLLLSVVLSGMMIHAGPGRAQEPGVVPPAPGETAATPARPAFMPHRTGWVHEGGVALSAMADGNSLGISGHYSGLYRPLENLSFGVHLGFSNIGYDDPDSDLETSVLYFFGALEGRWYLSNANWDFWGSIVFGYAVFTEVDSTSDALSNGSGPMLGLGLGLAFYFTARFSFGGFMRIYRLAPSGTPDSSTDPYLTWVSVGTMASLHF